MIIYGEYPGKLTYSIKIRMGFIIEGFTITTYKNKTIRYVDYSLFADKKEKLLELLKFATEEWEKQPLNSVLAVLNLKKIKIDMDILTAFKDSNERTDPYQKKIAIIGIAGLLKTGYNFVVGLTANSKIKTFDTELEAKEWLVSD